jgi:3-isopropylmalate/(R)-2-methylmalate dehydratase large subunit
MANTLFDKVWDAHVVKSIENGPQVVYIDKHFIHEVTTPQAFAGLDKRGLKVLKPQQTIATADHNVPTLNQHLPIREALSKKQVDTLIQNCENHGIELYGLGHPTKALCMLSVRSWDLPYREIRLYVGIVIPPRMEHLGPSLLELEPVK